MNAELLQAYRTNKLMLFVGAGVSANLSLPTWDELIAHIARELGYDPKIFATYGTPLALAEYYIKKKAAWAPFAVGWTANGTKLPPMSHSPISIA